MKRKGPISKKRATRYRNCSRSSWIDMYRGLPLKLFCVPESVNPDEVFPSRSGHDPHIPAPVELPFEGAEEMADDVDLKTAIIRFIITFFAIAINFRSYSRSSC